MASPLAQYVRRLYVTVPLANWGAAYTYAHNLGDGYGSGYTPQLATVTCVYVVDSTGVAHPVETANARVSAVSATNVSVIVGDAGGLFCAACTSALGGLPVSAIVEVEARNPHSLEIGKSATGDETIGLPANVGLPLSLVSGGGGVLPTTIDTVYVRTTGSDSADGHTVGTAWLTWQKAADYIMSKAPLKQSILVDVGEGAYGGNMFLEGVECVNGARFWFVGAVPTATLADGYKRLTITAGVGGLTTPRTHLQYRFTPNGADGWVDETGAPIDLKATDAGSYILIENATFGSRALATVSNVDETVGGVGSYLDFNLDSVVTPAGPIFLTAIGTTWTILPMASGSTGCTRFSGRLAVSNVKCGNYADMITAMPSGQTEERYNCIANTVFTRSNADAISFNDCERLALPGVYFRGANSVPTWNKCRDCSNIVNNAPGIMFAPESFYWPSAVWTRIGFNDVGLNNCWGGLGWCSNANIVYRDSSGTVGGLVFQRNSGTINAYGNSSLNLAWCALSPAGVNATTIIANDSSNVQVSYSKLQAQLRAIGPQAVCGAGTACSWTSTCIGDDAPVPATTTTHVQVDNGFLYSVNGGTVTLGAGNKTSYEGINADAGTNACVVQVSQCSKSYVACGGGHQTFFGNHGWILNYGGLAYISATGGTWTVAAKQNGAAHPDIFCTRHGLTAISENCALEKAAADVVVGPGVVADDNGVILIGDPTNNTSSDFLWGVGGGGEISVGAGNAVVMATNGGRVDIGNPLIAVPAGEYCITPYFGGRVFHGRQASSYLLVNNAAANAIQTGSAAATAAGYAAGAGGALLDDDFSSALGTRQGATYQRL